MRILQLVTRRQRRGAEVFSADLSVSLTERGHEISYVGLLESPKDSIRPAVSHVADLERESPGPLSPMAVLELRRLIRRLDPELIQANGGYAMKYAALARFMSRARWPLVYCNIGISSDWLRWPGQRAWNRWLLRRATLTAAVSDAARQDLIATYGLDPERIEVVRRGVDTDAVHSRQEGRAALAAIGVPAEADVLLHVGSFTPEKNHTGLLRIFERVQEPTPSAALVLVGDGPLRNEIKEKAGQIDSVHLLGLRNDVSLLMAGADLLVLPSLTEGIPGVILEAGAQGLPAVAYAVGGVGEAIADGSTGRLIEAGNEETFASAVLDLLADPTRRRQMGEAAQRLIEAEYSLERSVDAFEALYRRALASSGPTPHG